MHVSLIALEILISAKILVYVILCVQLVFGLILPLIDAEKHVLITGSGKVVAQLLVFVFRKSTVAHLCSLILLLETVLLNVL